MLRQAIYKSIQKCKFSQLKRLTVEDLNDLERRSNGIIPMRDYMKWINKPQMMVRDTFFNSQRSHLGSRQNDSIMDFEPIFTEAQAKWLWTTYTLNDYPYFDLNIVTVFTNLPQCLKICKAIMSFFQRTLSWEQFNRINYFMVPLYQMKGNVSSRIVKEGIPGKVKYINDIKVSPFHVLGMENDYNNNNFWVQDPVYIVLMDDIIQNLSHDVVRVNSQYGTWEQGHLKFNTQGTHARGEFHEQLDQLCSKTVTTLQDCMGEHDGTIQYIPSQLIQLFEVIGTLTPEYRIFALDVQEYPCVYHAGSSWKRLLSQWTHWGHGHETFYLGSSVPLNNPDPELRWDQTNRYHKVPTHVQQSGGKITFAPNFKQLKQICLQFNPNSHTVDLQSLYSFVSQWYQTKSPEQEKIPWKALRHSKLALLHSHLV